MAPPKKRSKLEREKEEQETHGFSAPRAICIPEEVIFFKILVFLSSKTLTKLKCVCRSWCDFISGDPLFPLHQGRRAVSSSAASGMVYSWCKKTPLTFLQTSGAPIGVPDPHLTFLHFLPGQCRSVSASTNGLLCLQFKIIGSNEYLYICNPATKEGHVVPNFFSYCSHHVGLAFDPINSPGRYKLVCPRQDLDSIIFKVFSSETSKWIESNQKLDIVRYMHYKFDLLNSIYVGGVLYWNISDCIIYFDPEKDDVAGITQWPFELQTSEALWRQGSQSIGVCEGRVTCTRFSIKLGLELWIMSSAVNGRWEKKYHMNLERMLELNLDVLGSYWRMTTLRSRKLLGEMTSDNYIVPIAFDGGREIYLWVKKKNKVLCFDMNSGRVTELCKNIKPIYGGVFLYANSMIPVPKLSQLLSPLV